MNERIKDLLGQSTTVEHGVIQPRQVMTQYHVDHEKFAELIVKECIYTLQLKIVRNGNTPENQRSREHIRDFGEKFGITFPMDYYPDKD